MPKYEPVYRSGVRVIDRWCIEARRKLPHGSKRHQSDQTWPTRREAAQRALRASQGDLKGLTFSDYPPD